MTKRIIDVLTPYCVSPPHDLVALFSRDHMPADADLSINVLPLAEAIQYTDALQRHTILGEAFGLIALEDANNSNPFCYVSKGPTRGCVMYLCHDGDSGIAFSSLGDFLSAIDGAIASRTRIDEIACDETLGDLDRRAVATFVAENIADDDRIEEICVLVPVLQTSDIALMTVLSQHPDFFVREAVAELLAKSPNMDLMAICQELASDQHPQVARSGESALSAVNRLKSDQ